MICPCSKTYCCYDAKSDKYKFSSKSLNKRTLEETADGFRTKNHCVATYEQTKKGMSYFYPKRVVLADGFHNEPIKL